MAQVIEQHSHNKDIRFAHRISNDFDNQRHVTAGVAVVFEEKFEKPTAIQIINCHLEDGKLARKAVLLFRLTTMVPRFKA